MSRQGEAPREKTTEDSALPRLMGLARLALGARHPRRARHHRRAVHALRVCALATLALCMWAPAAAHAGQTVTLETAFKPDRLEARTTIEFGFQIHGTIPGQAPSPVTDVDLRLPAGLGLATSTLGLANCAPAALLAQGPAGCPANARIGFGSALVAVSAEDETVLEGARLTTLVGEPNSEHLEVLFYAEGKAPVAGQLVFPGEVLDANGPSSGRLNTTIPLIPTWPGGADIAVTRMRSTIGPLGLTYYRRVGRRVVPFHPRGIAVPGHCPRGGFAFGVEVTFLDGASASATSAVPCPR